MRIVALHYIIQYCEVCLTCLSLAQCITRRISESSPLSFVYRSRGKEFILTKYKRSQDRTKKYINKSYIYPIVPIKTLIDEVEAQNVDNADDLFFKIAKWRWWRFEELLKDPYTPQLLDSIKKHYNKFDIIKERELKKYVSAVLNKINKDLLGADPFVNKMFDEDITPFYYIRRVYIYLKGLAGSKFRPKLLAKYVKNSCEKLTRWNLVYTMNLEFLANLYVVISNFEGYTFLPTLHAAILDRIKNDKELGLFLQSLAPKQAYHFLTAFFRYELFTADLCRKGEESELIHRILDYYYNKLVSAKPSFNAIFEEILDRAIKFYKSAKNASKSPSRYDDLTIFTELAITVARYSKEYVSAGTRIVSVLGEIPDNIAIIHDSSLYLITVLLSKAIENSDYKAVEDVLCAYSDLRICSLSPSLGYYVVETLVLLISSMKNKDISKDEAVQRIIEKLKIIIGNNPEYDVIAEKLALLYEFNYMFDDAVAIVNEFKIDLTPRVHDRLTRNSELIKTYGDVSKIPNGILFEPVNVLPLRLEIPIQLDDDFVPEMIRPGSLDEHIWVISRELLPDGTNINSLILNVGEGKVHGVWSKIGLCMTGFFPSKNYKIMDLYNNHIDDIKIASSGGSWRLYTLIDLVGYKGEIKHENPLELAKYVYKAANDKCEDLFEKSSMVKYVTIIVGHEKQGLKSANSRKGLAKFIEAGSSYLITHPKYKDSVTLQL